MKVVYIMDYLEGGELLGLLEEMKVFPEDLARKFFKQITEAMVYCHNQQLIHRDLKLENLLFTDNNKDTIKVIDFGIAGGQQKLDIDNCDAGSLSYMSPEALSGKM